MKIKAKLVLSFSAIAGICAVVGFIGLRGLSKTSAAINEIGDIRLPSVEGLLQMADGQLGIHILGHDASNLVHIGHDTVVGKICLFAAQVGIAGATTIEDEVMLWGQVGVSKTLTIGKGAEVFAQSGVPASLDGGKKYFGSPAEDALTKKKELVWIKRLPALWEKVMSR